MRRILSSLAAVVAVLTGGVPDDDDLDEPLHHVPSWATRAVVAGAHVEVDLADSVTGTDLAMFVARTSAHTTLDFHTLTGARLRVDRARDLDRGRLGAATTAWLAYAAADGSADATLDGSGRLSFTDGT